jgi:hypothetical protein
VKHLRIITEGRACLSETLWSIRAVDVSVVEAAMDLFWGAKAMDAMFTMRP